MSRESWKANMTVLKKDAAIDRIVPRSARVEVLVEGLAIDKGDGARG